MSLIFVKCCEKCGVILFDFVKSNLFFNYLRKVFNEVMFYRKNLN